MATEITRPELATDEALNYLDDLRESGVTNMFGAAPYLAREFGMEPREARGVLSYWMATFGARHPA
jgi:hypothetical protein